MAKRNSQLTELLIVAQDDYLTIVDTSAGQSKRVSVKNLTGAPDVGWTATGEAWTFSSFNTTTRLGVMTVPTDATTKYSIGMWVRIVQSTGGTKWAMITAVTATTITANFFSTQTLNNEAISTPVYSPLAQPFGAPKLPVRSTDANGWQVFDFGTIKEWTKKGSFLKSLAGSPNADAGWEFYAYSANLPVGMSTLSTNILTGSSIATDAAILSNIGASTAATNLAMTLSNQYTSSVNNFTIYWQAKIKEA